MGDLKTPGARVGGREIALWALAVFAYALLFGTHPVLGNDSLQYLSVARNLLGGRGLSTDLVCFDVERARGLATGPLTTFPSGYPMVMAALSLLGIAPEAAGLLISGLAMASSVALLGYTFRVLTLPVWIARFLLLLFAANANTLLYSRAVMTESLFTSLVVGGVVLVMRADSSSLSLRTGRLLSLCGGLLLGLSYWVRYAGMLVIGGVGIGLTILWFVRRNRLAAERLVLTSLPAGALVLVGFVRNMRLSGSWQGGNGKVVHNSFAGVAKTTVQSFEHLFVGDAAYPLARLLRLVTLLLVAWLVAKAWRRPRMGMALVLVGLFCVYSAMMFRLGMSTVISYDSRMFFPILPVLLLLVALCIDAEKLRQARGAKTVGVLAAATYLSCGALALAQNIRHTPPVERVASRLSAAAPTGERPSDWFDHRLPPREPLLASSGQITGYLLKRPVVDLLESEYSEATWDEPTVEGTMDRFGIRYLLLFRHPIAGGAMAQTESKFLTGLLSGQPEPHFKLAMSTDEVVVFGRQPSP